MQMIAMEKEKTMINMGIPQILFIILLAMSLGIHITRHGETRDGEKYNVWIASATCAIEVGLLIWGGFFT